MMKNVYLKAIKSFFLCSVLLGTALFSTACNWGNNQKVELTTYKVEQGNNLLLLNGVTEKNKQDLAERIFESLSSQKEERFVKYTDPDFVDADKYCYTKEGFDSTLCWSASASNILRISGWAEDFVNPLVKEGCVSYEDDLFTFFTSCFTDKGNLSEYALSYYFDGLLGATSTGGATLLQEATEVKPALGSSYTGYMPKICASALASSVFLDDQPEYISQVEKLDEQAIELSIMKIDTTTKETIASSGHSLTLTGVLLDKTKSGNERYVALLLADSDNEASAQDLPSSFETANRVKREKPNSYTLYFTDTFDGKFGFYYGDNFAQITELTCLPFKSDKKIAEASEKKENATCSASTSADLVSTFFNVYSEDNFTNVYKAGEKLNMTYFIVNRSDTVAMTKENAEKECLESEIRVYCDDVYIGSISEGLSYDLTDAISPKQRVIGQVTYIFSAPGAYKVQLVLNTNGCKEAYTLNNSSPTVAFTIQEN